MPGLKRQPDWDEDRSLTFEQIVENYEKKIFNLILHYVGDRDEAEDLTQETFLSARKYFDARHAGHTVHTWLCRLALAECRRRFRERDQQPDRPTVH
jgi:RNA polymerase sigma-70 factor, ECF subfamily